MKSDKTYLPFIVAIIASFTVSNSLIAAPFYKDSMVPLFLAFFMLGGVAALYIALQKTVLPKLKNKPLCIIADVLVAIASAVVAVFAFREYTDFIYSAVLIKSDMCIIKAVFALCVFCLAVSEKTAVYKFSLLSAVLASAVFAVLFFLSSKTFDSRHLKGIFSLTDFSLYQTAEYLIKMFLPILVCMVYIRRFDKTISFLWAGTGIAYGFLLCLFVIFDSVLSFGLPFSARLSYPYINDISTVNIGSLFTRMDGFAYFAFFACYLVKCAVCIKLASSLLYRGKYKKVATAILSALLVFF